MMTRIWCTLRRHRRRWETESMDDRRVVRVRACRCGRRRDVAVFTRWMWDYQQALQARMLKVLKTFPWDADTFKVRLVDNIEEER